MPRVLQVIEVEEMIGQGTPDQPYSGVNRYYTLDGEEMLGQAFCPVCFFRRNGKAAANE